MAGARGTPVLERRRQLPADPVSVRGARRFAADTLTDWGCSELVDTVTLLLSELVTNAVLHAGTDVQVTIRRGANGVQVGVADEGSGAPEVRHYSDDAVTGRGLSLVEALSQRWWVESDGRTKVVWFEVASP